MFDPEDIKKALAELERLNGNLETLHRDAASLESVRQDVRALVGTLRDCYDKFKAMPVLAKQIATLNQILLQTKKMAGTSGMIQSILEGVIKMAQKSG